jgi:hypothetical protein
MQTPSSSPSLQEQAYNPEPQNKLLNQDALSRALQPLDVSDIPLEKSLAWTVQKILNDKFPKINPDLKKQYFRSIMMGLLKSGFDVDLIHPGEKIKSWKGTKITLELKKNNDETYAQKLTLFEKATKVSPDRQKLAELSSSVSVEQIKDALKNAKTLYSAMLLLKLNPKKKAALNYLTNWQSKNLPNLVSLIRVLLIKMSPC